MPTKLFKSDMGFRIDKTSTLVDISAYMSAETIQSAITMLEDTGAGVAMPTLNASLAHVTLPIAGVINTTTEAIFGPCLDGTSVSKTFEYKAFTSRYYNGECYPSNLQITGSRDTMELFSGTLNLTGALNRTSVALT